LDSENKKETTILSNPGWCWRTSPDGFF